MFASPFAANNSPNVPRVEKMIQLWRGIYALPHPSPPPFVVANWQRVVREQMLPLKWSLVMEDVGSFIIDSEGRADFNKAQLLGLLD